MISINRTKSSIIAVAIVILISFVIYYHTAPIGNIGYGDSDEIITVAHLMGVAHPSGYPLVIVLTKLFSQIPIAASIAFRSHLLAMVTHAITVGLIAVCGYVITRNLRQGETPSSISLFSIFSSLFLTFSAIFWLYGGIIEVGALNNMFAGILFLATICWQLSVKPDNNLGSLKWWLIMWAVTGLGLSTVHTFILLVPGVLVAIFLAFFQARFFFWKTQIIPKRILPAFGILFISWLIPNLLLFWLNSNHATMSWVFDQSLNGWWRLIARRDYSGTILDQEKSVSAYISIHPLTYYLNGAVVYVKFMFQQLTWPMIAVTFLGLTAAWKLIPRRIIAVAMTFWLISGLLLGIYMGAPEPSADNLEYRLLIGISHRQYQLGHISFALLTVMGVASLASLLSTNRGSKFAYNSSQILLLIVVVGALVYQFRSNYDTANQSNNTLLKDYARNMLDTAESGSVIVCFSDISCYSLLHEQLVDNYKTDVTVLLKNNFYRKYFLIENPQYQGHTYGYNPFFASEIISWNVSQRTTYITEPDGYYSQYMGFDANPFYLIPRGYLYQVSTQVPLTISDDSDNYSISQTLVDSELSPKNYLATGLKDYFAYKHMTLGFLYSKLGHKSEARFHQEMAIQLNSQVSQPRQLLSQLDQYPGDERYAPGTVSPSAAEIITQYHAELEASEANNDTEMLNQSYKTLLKAVFREPKNPEARLELAKLYQSGGYPQESRSELEYILKYNPDFAPAQQMLDQTSGIQL